MQSKNKLSKNHRLWAKLIQTLTFSTKAQFRFDVPEDGLPPIDDWITTFFHSAGRFRPGKRALGHQRRELKPFNKQLTLPYDEWINT